MHLSTTLLSAGLASVALAAYTLQDDYSGNNFFSMFTYDTFNDPTNGYVNYVDAATAQSDNLTSVSNGVITIRSDSTNIASGRGRNSVRVTSTMQYTHGLVVLDLAHMPGSACGIWPAFWMTGPNWPSNGEIDIVEGVNLQTQDAITMHTNAGCTMISKSCEGGTGCGVQAGGPTSFGDGFNNAGGGVFAMRWTSSAIDVWSFSRGNVPQGATGDTPDPSAWGSSTASFQGGDGCNIDEHFKDNNIVFDTTFCGDWAGAVWGQDSTCASKAATCQDYVRDNPQAFGEAYWTINALKVYTDSAGTTNTAGAESQPAQQQITAPIAQSTTTSAISSPTPSPSTMPFGPVTENPNPPRLMETEDGQVQWPAGPGKRDIDVSFRSMVEGQRGDVSTMKVGRHLRRHVLGKGHGGGHGLS